MRKVVFPIVIILVMCKFVFAQSFLHDLEKIKKLKFLESTKEDAIKLLNNEDVGYRHSANFKVLRFYTEDSNITVFYSSGNCADKDEDWNIDRGKITEIRVSPKNHTEIKDLGIVYLTLRKERVRKDYKKLFVYHNKNKGIAIWAYDKKLESIDFTPPKNYFSLLCDKKEVKNYYKSKKWLRKSSMYNATYHNYPSPNVTDLNLSRSVVKKGQDSKIKVKVSIEYVGPTFGLPIYYDYRVSGGRIIGIGKEVVWDLLDVKSGTYKITAIADDGCGPCGKWMTKTVVVK